jgi:hypothetical protein
MERVVVRFVGYRECVHATHAHTRIPMCAKELREGRKLRGRCRKGERKSACAFEEERESERGRERERGRRDSPGD